MSALLSVSHVDAYYGGIQALRDVSLHIDAGEIVSVLGANGAGKSTLLKCLSREIRTRRGDITFDGRPLPGKSYGVVEAGMVIVPEGRQIFTKLTVLENLQIGCCLRSDKDSIARERHGGTYIDTAKQDALETVARWSDGRLADVVYECIGLEATLDQAIRMAKPGGRLMVMGVFGKKPVVDMNTLQEAERSILTSQAHVDEIATALERLRAGRIDASELITRVVTLDTLVEDGFEHLIAHGPEHIKVLIQINGQEEIMSC